MQTPCLLTHSSADYLALQFIEGVLLSDLPPVGRLIVDCEHFNSIDKPFFTSLFLQFEFYSYYQQLLIVLSDVTI